MFIIDLWSHATPYDPFQPRHGVYRTKLEEKRTHTEQIRKQDYLTIDSDERMLSPHGLSRAYSRRKFT